MSDKQIKIGLETHVQLNTETKLFCGCPNEEVDQSNSNVCEICLGHPGSKPRFNEKVLEAGIKTAEALKCEIPEEISFSRKTYFYPDMSKNYQITQYEIPLGSKGEIILKTEEYEKKVGLRRIHIEEDPAKLEHEGGNISSSDYTLIDYNRAGTPLLEIVTEPVLKTPEQAKEYIEQLAKILEYLGLYTPESSYSIKSDANISIQGGERVEIKNITGAKAVKTALKYEISRQGKKVDKDKDINQHTRSYDPETQRTTKMREKETEEDYGYIFDPDLTRQKVSQELRDKIREGLPELPNQMKQRIKQEYDLDNEIVESLIIERQLAEDFEKLVDEHDPKLTASWMTGELKKTLNYNELRYSDSGFDAEFLHELIEMIEQEDISDRNAEKIIREYAEKNQDEMSARAIAEEKDLLKAEEGEVDSIVKQVVQDNQDAVEDFEDGDKGAINFLVGQVMQESQGKADPKQARKKLLEELE